MQASAFCPAHITGFFKPIMNKDPDPLKTGSVGAGFSISHGVHTSVKAERSVKSQKTINVYGKPINDKLVSERVVAIYEKMIDYPIMTYVEHKIDVPVGYGLGCSGAVALSLSLALNSALGLNLSRKQAAQIAHKAEIECKTGLGDVSGALEGGFEIRIRAGAPGIGEVKKTPTSLAVVIVCFAPVSTRSYITENIEKINGLGGKMIAELGQTPDNQRFQDMSIEFAKHIGIITTQMQEVIDTLDVAGIKCGVAIFGQTVFALASTEKIRDICDILKPYKKYILVSSIDNDGARLE